MQANRNGSDAEVAVLEELLEVTRCHLPDLPDGDVRRFVSQLETELSPVVQRRLRRAPRPPLRLA